MKKWAGIRVVIILVAALAGSMAAQESPQETRPPKLNFTRHTLANGLDVILLEEHAVPVVDLQIWYHVEGKTKRRGIRDLHICSNI